MVGYTDMHSQGHHSGQLPETLRSRKTAPFGNWSVFLLCVWVECVCVLFCFSFLNGNNILQKVLPRQPVIVFINIGVQWYIQTKTSFKEDVFILIVFSIHSSQEIEKI